MKKLMLGMAVACTMLAAFADTYYVDPTNGVDDVEHDGTTWAKAKKTLVAVMDLASNGDTVQAAEGVYDAGETVKTLSGHDAHFRVSVPAGVTLVATGAVERTIIKGAKATVGLYNGCGADSVACVHLGGSGATVQGFTIRNGYAWYSSASSYVEGGGVYASGSKVVDCRVVNNTSYRAGAGEGGTWVRCYFSGNAGTIGNGVEVGTLANCVVGSHADYFAFNCNIYNCTFLSSCKYAIRETYGTHTVCNSLILGSSASSQGGAFRNCVIGNNTATKNGTYTDCTKATTAAQVAIDSTTYMPDGSSLAVDAANATLLPAAYGDFDFHGTNRTIGVGLDVGAVENDYVVTVEAEEIAGITYEGIAAGTNKKAVPFAFTVRKGTTKRPMTGIMTNGVFVAFGADDSVTFAFDKICGAIAVTKPTDEPVTWYVDEKQGTDEDPIGYLPGADAYASLQAAMENPNLLAGDTVSAAEGVYSNGYYRIAATATMPVCDSRVYVKAGVKLVASGSRSKTIILGKAGSSDSGFGAGCVRCAIVGANAVLQGFTLKNGYAARYDTSYYYQGGGASVYGGGIVVDCDILNCAANRGGAGDGGTWIRCYFNGNWCGQIGAGFYGSGSLYNCVIKSTSGSYFGCTTKFYNCTFLDGTVEVMRGLDSGCLAVNCLIQSGKANGQGNGYLKCCAYPNTVTATNHAINCICTNAAGVKIESATYEPVSGTAMIDNADESLVTFPAGYGDTDFNGKPRKSGDAMDIGAVEWQGYALTVAEPPAGVTFEGVTVGKNAFGGQPLTFKVKRAVAGGRLVSCVVLDGETHFFGDEDELELTVTDTTRDIVMTVPDKTIFYVDEKLGSDANDGVRAGAGALATLQAASDKTISGDTVYVAEGVYDANALHVAASGKLPAYDVRVNVKAGVKFIASGRRSETLIVGQRGTASDLGEGAVRCVNLGAGAFLQGFTVTNGYAVVGANDFHMGGGVSADSNAYIVDCDIVNCRAQRAGAGTGGIWIRCYFSKNVADSNIATGLRSANVLYNCVIGQHTSYFCWDGGFYNCTFLPSCNCAFRNTSEKPNGNLYNCLILSPTASDQGGVFKNCVFGKNTKFSKTLNWTTNNCLMAKTAAEVAYDPATFEPLKGTLAVDAGDASLFSPTGFDDTDYRGSPRLFNGATDAGAVEYDWRGDFARALGNRRVTVAEASGYVTTNAVKGVDLADGELVTIAWRLGKGRATFKGVVAGEGSLTVLVDGEVLEPESGVYVVNAQTAQTHDVVVSFAGAGKATLSEFKYRSGLVVIVR